MGVSIFFAGSWVVEFAGGVFSVTAFTHAVIRFFALKEVWGTDAFFKVRAVVGAMVYRDFEVGAGGQGIALKFTADFVV